jgi:hypothetical protein
MCSYSSGLKTRLINVESTRRRGRSPPSPNGPSGPLRRGQGAMELPNGPRIGAAISPRPCLSCAMELPLCIEPLRRGAPPRQRVVKAAEKHIRLCLLGCHHHPRCRSSRSCTPWCGARSPGIAPGGAARRLGSIEQDPAYSAPPKERSQKELSMKALARYRSTSTPCSYSPALSISATIYGSLRLLGNKTSCR